MASRFDLPHIDISGRKSTQQYSGSATPRNSGVRVREEHGRRLQNELRAALRLADAERPSDDRLPAPGGAFVEVELLAGTPPDVLERKRDKMRPGAVKLEENNNRKVALYIPDGKREVLEKIIEDYLGTELTEEKPNPPNKAKVEAIQAFRRARLETFWTDDPAALPSDPQQEMWWALWCWSGSEAAIEDVCARLALRAGGHDRRLYFPELVVIPVLATRAAIELMLFATGAIAELRRANDSPAFFTDDVRGDQHEWSDDLARRIVWPASDVPRVCVLDTGVNRGHALIEPALATTDLHTLDAAWGVDDQDDEGHGTAMAGMALHGDLTAALSDQSQRTLAHRLESVKLLPPRGFDPNEPQSYGALTQAAIARPEITAPDAARVFCMAITNEDVSGAAPSSWSAALDQIAAGTMPGDDHGTSPKRLFVVATGNIAAEINFKRRLGTR
jgi:subtilase family protein